MDRRLIGAFFRTCLTIWFGGASCSVGIAGVPVQLPPGEDRSAWGPALDFAGLDLAADGDEARIHMDLTEEGWVLVAVDDGGVVRTARVAPPDNPAEREAVALLARGLIRPMGAMPTPPPPAPPRPSAPITAAPEPSPWQPEEVPPPVPERAESPEPPVPGRTVISSPELWALETRPLPELVLWRTPPGPIEDLDVEPIVRRRTRKVISPAIHVGNAVVVRGGTGPGLVMMLGTEMAQSGRFAADLHLSGTAPQQLVRGDLQRNVASVEVTAGGRWRPSRMIAMGPVAGLAYRIFHQQGVPVGEYFTPFLGVGGTAALLSFPKWSLELDLRGIGDLTRTQLVLEDGQIAPFSPLELLAGLHLSLGGRSGDPFVDPTTLSE